MAILEKEVKYSCLKSKGSACNIPIYIRKKKLHFYVVLSTRTHYHVWWVAETRQFTKHGYSWIYANKKMIFRVYAPMASSY
jgi:hypothetical protein